MPKDQFKVLLEGNLISEPEVKVDSQGRALWTADIASNPYGISGLPHHLKTRRRSAVKLVGIGKIVAALTAKNVGKGDRLEIIGTGSSRWQPTQFWSNEHQNYITLRVEFEGKKILIGTQQLSVRIHTFDKKEEKIPQNEDSVQAAVEEALTEIIAEVSEPLQNSEPLLLEAAVA